MMDNGAGATSALAELIVRSATDFAIVTSDADGIITSWSPGAEQVMGWTAQQAIGQPADLFFTPEDVTAGRPAAEMACARIEGRASDERWHVRADGTRFWASGEMQPLREAGGIVGFLKILRDRTEHHELGLRLTAAKEEAAAASAQLRGEGERLRELFAAAPGFIAVLRGPTHIYEIANESYMRLVAHRELIGKPIREALPEVEGQGYFELFDEVFRTGKPITGHNMSVMLWPTLGAQPEERIVDYVFQPTRGADGTVNGVFLEGFDVTDAAAARAAADKLAAEQAAILGQLGEGVIATDAAGRITFVNAAAERLHGVSRLDVQPDDYSDTYQLLTEAGDPHPPAELPLARAVMRGETVIDARWRIRRPDGSEVLAIGNAQPVIADGTQIGAVLTLRDDTERRTAEGALDESRSYLRLLLDSTAEAFYSVDRQGETTLCNAAFVRMLGFADEREALGQKLHGVIHHSHPDGTHYAKEDCPIYRCAQTGVAAVVTNELFYRLDGTPVPVEYRVSPIRHDGELRGAICTFFDISERLAAERALRNSETQSRNLLEGMNEGFITLSRDYRIETINAEGLRIDGRSREDIAGRHILEVWPETEQLPNWPLFVRGMEDRQPGSVVYRHLSDSHEMWVETRVFPIEDGIAIFYRDVTERQIAAERLCETEERYRLAGRATNDAIWDWDFATNAVLWNEALHTAFGHALETVEPTGDWWIAHIHPDDVAGVDTSIHAAIDGSGSTWTGEYRFRRSDGSYAHVLDRGTVIRDADGRATRMIGAMLDLSQRKADEAAVRSSDERYRALFDAIDAGFCILELKFDEAGHALDYRMVEINPAFERQTGLVDATGRWIRDLVEIEQHWIDFYGEVARTGVSMRRESGSEALGRWFDVYAFPIDEPRAKRIAVLFNDISDRKQAELQLTELNRTLESRVAATVAERDMIWRTSQDLFVVTGLDGLHRNVNPAWTDALGYQPAELIGSLAGAFIHPDDVHEARAELAQLARGHVINGLDLRMLHKDGGTRWFSWTCVPQGDVFYASGRDVTARKELEEQLRQSQKMEAVGQLTGGIAHDFNNLLTIVSGNIDMARRSLGVDGDARVLRSLGNAAKGADRAAALTQRLLAFSRRQPLQPRATDVNKLITGMTELLDRALGETVDLQVVAGAGLWRVEVDPNQLENAILNLAVNARDAMPGGGKLTVETSNSAIDDAYVAAHREVATGQYVLVSVTDTGEGMPADIVAKAFDPFFSTKDVGKGTGLGLSQVYGYVKQSGGHVKIYSETGEGTTVKLYLPRLIADMNAADEEVADPEVPSQGQESILVVEDDDDVRIYTVDSLRELGYRVIEAHDGASALRLLERQDEAPRLLLTDVVMPGMSGRELADHARTLYPDMQILYTTGYARNAIVHGGRLDPGVELLPKPFTFEALAAKVREVIERAVVERALVIDPADDARASSAALLEDLGFAAEQAGTVREALGKLRAAAGAFDVVMLSDAVPVGNLDAVLAELHAVRSDLPILIVGSAGLRKVEARYQDAKCIGMLAQPFDAAALREALNALRVRCAAR